MRWITVSIACVLLSPAGAPAVEIAGLLKIREHTMTRLYPDKAPEGAAFLWDFDGERLSGEECGPNLFLTGAPGSYRISLIAIALDGKGKLIVERARAVLEIEAVTPPTPPGPPKPPPPPPGKVNALQARVKINFAGSGCTATVIGPRRPDGRWNVLTAAHCIGGVGQKGTGLMPDGTNLVLTVTARESASDIAWLVTDQPGQDLYSAVLAEKCPAPGTPIWNAGYGVRDPGKKQLGQTTAPCDSAGQLWYSIEMSPGDSGSGQFRQDNDECVATLFGTKGGRGVGGGCERARQLLPSAQRVEYVLRQSAGGWVLDEDGYWRRREIRLLSPTLEWVPGPLGRW